MHPPCLPAEEGHFLCVQSLLRRGANPDLPDSEGTTALLAALAGGHRRAAEALLAAGAQTGGRTGAYKLARFATEAERASLRCRQSLLNAVSATSTNTPHHAAGGRSALHWAAHHGFASVLRSLLEQGGAADMDAEDEAG